MKRYFCTYFDENYLTRGLALFDSLSHHGTDFTLYVLCLSDSCYEILTTLAEDRIVPIHLQQLESACPELLSIKPTRTIIEYFFTCTPAFPRFIFQQFKDVDLLAYVDADLYFFNSYEYVFSMLGSHDIGIVPHGFGPKLTHLVEHGIYNVGLVAFRNNVNGRSCLDDWYAKCLAWCFDRVEDGKFADQKYLDSWPSDFQQVKVLDSPGIGLAPWNAGRYEFEMKEGSVHADGHPLIFFHYHGFRRIRTFWYDTGLHTYGEGMTGFLKKHIFLPYARALKSAEIRLAGVAPKKESITRARPSMSLRLFLTELARGRFLFSMPARSL